MTKGTVVALALGGVVGLTACRRETTRPNVQTTVTEETGATATAHTNRLAREKSPYLLQHQHNPVDWYAWGEEAFTRAREQNRPIFLSIGYSTCHWCHVMERESFESPEVAGYLNAHFVSIKVDREERPDVDKIYMTFVQTTSGQGGWPLNVFLTPDLKPFFGGTYFPPDSRYGRQGFLQILKQVDQLWQTRRAELANSAADIHARLEQLSVSNDQLSGLVLTAAVVREAGALLKQSYDTQRGGFGGEPKFPQPSQPQFLLRYARRFGDEEAVRMVLHTCDHMAAGGIHDHLGGGFARYSVDAEWLVPHFEKMLYDNAQLAQLYLDACLVVGQASRLSGGRLALSPSVGSTPRLAGETPAPLSEPAARYAEVVRDILDYVLRDMTHPDGGFYSAEDADSEGHEGKFYCWTRAELAELLTPEEFKVAARYFGITEQGNFMDHSHPQPLPNQNVLSIVDSALTEPQKALLASAKIKMSTARAHRVRPLRDDKVLASWNGLMLGAMARAGLVLDQDAYRAAAVKNLAFLKTRLWDAKTSTLYHRWRDGQRDSVQLLEGYAFLLAGVIELYETTLNAEHLDFAIALAETMLARFYDTENGGFWQSTAGAKDLILRVKEDYDGAEPSGNSVAIFALLKLGKITDRNAFTQAAEKSLRLFAHRLQQVPQAVPYMLQALDFSLDEPWRAVVAGDPGSPGARALLRSVHSGYQPNKVVLGNTGPVEPFARTLAAKEGPVVYLCSGTACQPPTSDPARIKALLTAILRAGGP